ncbi:MAG: glucodextranase DOMON-like domain-containing protein, partial [Candidatus Kariarchaeaceae archaeon]
MKNKGIGVVLFIVTLSMLIVLPKDIAAIPTAILSDASSHNDVVIDGTIGTDWFDGNKTLTTDPYGDEAWGTGGDWGLNDLYTSLNSTGFAVGLNASLVDSSNGFLVFFDTDNGATGVTDHNTADAWSRNAEFENSFKTNWYLGTWGLTAWDLRNFTVDDGTTFTYNPGASGYAASTGNITTSAGSSIIHYEAFIPWSLFYPSGIPANAEIRIVAAMFGGGGGDSPADMIPNNVKMGNPEKVSNYIVVAVDSDGDSNPELTPEPTSVAWAGNEADNSFAGTLPKGYILETKISVYTGSHDHPNASDWATLKTKVYDDSAALWGSWNNVSMTHEVYDYDGNNDWYRYELDTIVYDENDTITWMIETSYGPTAEYNVTISPLPPIDIEEISAIEPSGGFILPGQLINITANVGQLLNGTTLIHQAPGTVVTLYWETNMSGTWNMKDFTFLEESGTAEIPADKFNVSIGPYINPTNVTFYINATNNNTVTTSNITVFVLVPPPETQVFSMTDPEGDEYGVYPTDASFDPYVGLLDILNFTVTSNAWVTTFHFKMYNNSNPWSGPTGFSHPTFMVMVDSAAGGNTDSYGNAYVNTDVEWDHGFQVTSWEKWYWTDSENVTQSGTGISINTN